MIQCQGQTCKTAEIILLCHKVLCLCWTVTFTSELIARRRGSQHGNFHVYCMCLPSKSAAEAETRKPLCIQGEHKNSLLWLLLIFQQCLRSLFWRGIVPNMLNNETYACTPSLGWHVSNYAMSVKTIPHFSAFRAQHNL